MEKIIIQSNEAKFHQTEGGSQLLEDDIIATLGSHGEGPHIPNVLQGTFIPPESASEDTIEFLNSCRLPSQATHPTSHSHSISRYEDHVNSWLICKETTCTHNHHIGHYKSAFQDDLLN